MLTLALGMLAPSTAWGTPEPPQMHTVAGGGSCSGSVASGGTCDGVAATKVPIVGARSVAALPGGGYLYVDSGNDLVRQVSATGKVTTVAGTSNLINGHSTPSTTDIDGVPATQSGLDDPVAAAPLPNGGFLITEYGGSRVRMVSPGPPGEATITTIAGIPPTANRSAPTPGNNGTAGVGTSMELNYPSDAVPTASGGVLIADTYNNRILLLTSINPGATVQQIAGGGSCNDASGRCQADSASQVQLDLPDSVAELADGSGGYLVSEFGAGAVREISRESQTGVFTTVVGTPGSPGYSGDGAPATTARLNEPEQVLSLGDGSMLIADTGNNAVREVLPNGYISTIAGNGTLGYTGDGGAATDAQLNGPAGVAPVPQGGILIADDNNGAIREVTQPPVTTIRLWPSYPNGANGWYTIDPLVSMWANEAAITNCVADPGQAPPAFAAFAPGCPYAEAAAPLAGDGFHTIYAASQNNFGDQENPVSLTVKIDTAAPTVRCGTKPAFHKGQARAKVTAVLSDSVSGPARLMLAAMVKTDHAGMRTVLVRGKDRAGLTGAAKCPYTVR